MDKSFIARETARLLLEVEAIQFNPEKPYIFTSGWASPVYTDCRKLISFPRLRKRLAAAPKAGDWLSRLQAERHEVAERLAKLREFMAAPKGNPTPRQLTLMAKQERAMSDYVWAMDDRIADAEAPE